MTSRPRRRRESLGPALVAALALHLGLFAIATLSAKPRLGPPTGTPTPITLVASAPTTDSSPAEAAPIVQEAQIETPIPRAKSPAPEPAPPRPPPPRRKAEKPAPARPTPPKPNQALAKPPPKPRPTPAAAPAKPAPTKPAAAKPDLNLDALEASLARSPRSAPPRPAFARRGPARPETAARTRVDAGQGVSQSDKAGLSELLNRLWNPNCSVEGGDAVTVPVTFAIGEDGRVVGKVSAGGREAASDPVAFAAARRAIDAVHQAEPYAAVYRRNAFRVNFDAKTACSNR